uniref:Uncharacterized protein n=1 Tax=Nelumbo nucifera TaxID=4432 RepID=A0A822Y5G8_NELNU|nr:TPA_asm: hypothetical protein HUJ06_027753 [Nelumbo nucifera]
MKKEGEGGKERQRERDLGGKSVRRRQI